MFPHKLPWKFDMVLRSQSGWRICAAGRGTRYKIAPIVFELFTGDHSCFRLFFFAFDIAKTEIHTWKKYKKIPRNEVSQDLMRFLELRIFVLDYFVALAFCVPVSLDSIFLLLYKNA